MILIDSVDNIYNGKMKGVLYADTKEEVPETGDATIAEIDGCEATSFDVGTLIYTPDFNFALLNSDDTWVWKE